VQDGLCLKDSNETIFLETNGTVYGLIERRQGNILQRLSQFQDIRLQLRAIQDSKTKHKGRPGSKRQGNFYAIVYGPFGLSDTVGDFLDANEVYLQAPQGCNTNVRYRNPHSLSGLDLNAPYTVDPDLATQKAPLREWDGSSNYLDGIEFSGELEAPTPQAITTPLLKHQRQGLYFMQQREKGWAFTSESDVWGLYHDAGVPFYRNRISDDDQLEQPKAFRGGILADEMGLGKTLTVAALIASDREDSQTDRSTSGPANGLSHTLVIVPPALLDTWEGELSKHCSTGVIHWARHHNSHKFTHDNELDSFDIVLTTYETVRREWQTRHTSACSILFRTHWHRLVLDEAHVIRNSSTKAAEAVCELQAERRWAVTGTPIQNHVTDFVALLQFLRVAPYDQPANFDSDIVQLWKVDAEGAISRLRKLIACVTLCRTSRNIELPPRQNYDQGLYFNAQEKQLYDAVSEMVETNMSSSNFTAKNNALQGINALRLVCSFGTLTNLPNLRSTQPNGSKWDAQAAQVAFNALLAAGSLRCLHCRTTIAGWKETSLDLLESNSVWDQHGQPEMTECQRVICGTCAPAYRSGGLNINWCEHGACASHPVSTHETALEQAPAVREPADYYEMPTKIKALCHDLTVNPDSKAVVFSEWRRTLDLTAQALQLLGIPFLRYDGTVSQRDRTQALEQFSSDPTKKVILFTIRCGAVGLDLTAADRVYLMEPQWNPTIEDQAFARVHRMGQKKPVTAIRYIMSDSYEEKVVSKQGRKKDFADIALSPKKSPGGGAGSWDQWKDVIG
jgi:SWI/SNF-related matrix-associated actin-dependent regulator of chromatin subfamily A3